MGLDLDSFDLVCLSCGTIYSGCFNNQACCNCGEKKKIRWMLKPEMIGRIKNPHNCTVENFNKNISIKISYGIK